MTGPALLNWAWADVIEEGHGGIISYLFGGDAPHGFARLHYTDEPRPLLQGSCCQGCSCSS